MEPEMYGYVILFALPIIGWLSYYIARLIHAEKKYADELTKKSRVFTTSAIIFLLLAALVIFFILNAIALGR